MFQKYKTKLKQLNLPSYSFRIAGKEGSEMIFDTVRRKWVKLTPEEWVRQNFIQYLVHEGKYPPGLISIEKMFNYNKLKRRADIVVYDRKGNPVLVVECKSYDVDINDEKIRDQIGEYNWKFGVTYVIITNGMYHYSYKYDPVNKNYEYMLVIPLYEELLTDAV
jgi:hypothetical protein